MLRWREGITDPEKRMEIELLGITKLGRTMPYSQTGYSQLISKPPNEWLKNETAWLMKPCSFDLQITCRNFLHYEAKQHGIVFS